jgi:universal stress protein A
MVRFTKILCPVDFSEHSKAALEHAEDVARKFGADLTLVHVVEPILYPVAYGLPPVSPVDYEQAARDSAGKALASLSAEVGARGGKAATRIESGAASQRICELAKAEGFDLIVLATHGYTGLKHVLLGSTAERVVRFAHCAVLVVKARPA